MLKGSEKGDQRMKTIVRKEIWIAVIVIGLFVTAGGIDKAWTAEQTPTKMIMTHEVSTTHFKQGMMVKYAKLVEERTGGKIKGEVYPGGQLYNDRDALVALGTGAVQMTWPISANLEQVNEGYGILNLPMCLEDELMLKSPEFRAELNEILSSLVGGRNIRVMGLIRSASGVICFGKKDIRTPEQMKGTKIRVTGGLICLDWIKELGASPIGMAASEMTTALSQGALDGIMTSPQGWSEIIGSAAKYGVDIKNFWPPTYSVLIDQRFWDKQSNDVKKVLQGVMDEMSATQWQQSIDEDKKAYEKLRNVTKVKVTVVSDQELAEKWLPRTKPTFERFSKKFPAAYKSFVDLNAKYGRKYPPGNF